MSLPCTCCVSACRRWSCSTSCPLWWWTTPTRGGENTTARWDTCIQWIRQSVCNSLWTSRLVACLRILVSWPGHWNPEPMTPSWDRSRGFWSDSTSSSGLCWSCRDCWFSLYQFIRVCICYWMHWLCVFVVVLSMVSKCSMMLDWVLVSLSEFVHSSGAGHQRESNCSSDGVWKLCSFGSRVSAECQER